MSLNQLRTNLGVLQLAIDFANEGGDRRSFVQQRLSNRDGGAWTKASPPPSDPDLQREVKSLLHAVLKGSAIELQPVTLRFGVKPKPADGTVLLTRAAVNERDLFIYQLVRLLEEVGTERLKVCLAPDCDRFFIKVTRKEFCSTRCQAKVNMRNVRERERLDREKERAARRMKDSHHGKTTRTR